MYSEECTLVGKVVDWQPSPFSCNMVATIYRKHYCKEQSCYNKKSKVTRIQFNRILTGQHGGGMKHLRLQIQS